MKGCSSKVVGGSAVTPLDHGSVDLSQVCTDFRYSPAEIVDGIEIIGFEIVVILSSHGLRGVEPKRHSQRLGSFSPLLAELDDVDVGARAGHYALAPRARIMQVQQVALSLTHY